MKSLSRAAVIAAVRKTSLTVAAVGNGGPAIFSPTDNGCTDEEHAANLS